MADHAKRTELICTKVDERMALDLLRACAHEDRNMSDYVHLLLRRHLYGHLKTGADDAQSTLVDKVDRA